MKTAVILAAGNGSKCWPYSPTRNKAYIPIANKPIIQWTIDALRKNGIENIIIVTGYRKEQIGHAVDDKITLVEQKAGTGTVPALLSAWDLVDDKECLVVYGDVLLTKENINTLLDNSAKSKTIASVLVGPLGTENPNDWLCAKVSDNKIEHVLGHPRDDVSHRFAGAFVLNKKFETYLQKNPGRMQAIQVAMMSPDEAHIEDSIQIALDDGKEIEAVDTVNRVVDVDKPWHILEANEVWLKYLSAQLEKTVIGKNSKISDGANIDGKMIIGDNCTVGPGVYIEGDLWLGDNSQITQGAIVEPQVSIGKNTIVRRYCQIDSCTSIGDDGLVGHGAEVSGVFFRRAWAYHYGEYWGVIGESSDLGAATVCGNLRFDDMEQTHRIKGRREIPKTNANAAYLGDYVRTGVNAILMPGVKVGPYSVLGAGAIIQNDVPDKSLIYVKQDIVKKQWGPEKYGW
jgi:UDP-N-acetylglucosamine diphosphorylase / glucose-1-phosphate thymidylyltransferase / UDP-N-acetylgalactosamine diphosphorylase / glucosamine-1-phosphate N-acetyltransferase / galactosamine-1-phosphate N-acetyltransferase